MIRRLTIVLVFISMFAVACFGGDASEDQVEQPDAIKQSDAAAQPEATARNDASVLTEPGAPADSLPE